MRRVVETQEAVIVERGGKPQVVLLSIQEFQRLQARRPREDDWRVLLDELHAELHARLGDRQLPPAEDILQQVREERDAELDAMR
jgi:prevent-host-death family protein